jgi:hypothetical protein
MAPRETAAFFLRTLDKKPVFIQNNTETKRPEEA